MNDIKKVVLAYSGGLDTSVILKWLQDTYQCEVVTFTADLGQGEELDPARQKALKFGIKPTDHIMTCARSSCATSSSPMFAPTPCTRANTCSAPRSRAADRQRLIEIVNETGADASATAPPARATTRCVSNSAPTR